MDKTIDLNYRTVRKIKKIIFKKEEKAFELISEDSKKINKKISGRVDTQMSLQCEEDFIVIVKLISKIIGKKYTRKKNDQKELIFIYK